MALARVGEELGETDDRVQGRAQLVAHVGEEHALVAVRFQERGVGLFQLSDQVAAVESGHECAHELLDAVHLVAAKTRREGAGHDDKGPRTGQSCNGQCHHAAFRTRERDPSRTATKACKLAAQLGDLRRADAANRGRPA